MCVALVAISLAGCTRFEEDDLFDESASLRVTHFNEQLQSRLVAQSQGEKNGWVIQYFVSGTDELDFEGFNLFGNFSGNGKVTMAGNHRSVKYKSTTGTWLRFPYRSYDIDKRFYDTDAVEQGKEVNKSC